MPKVAAGAVAAESHVDKGGSCGEDEQYDANGDGYVCWLRAAAGSEHVLTLKLVAPLAATAGETRLDLSLPRAAASRVLLHVAKANVAAEATVAGTAVAVEATAPKSGGSDLEVLGRAGDFSLVWRDADWGYACNFPAGSDRAGGARQNRRPQRASTDATLSVRSRVLSSIIGVATRPTWLAGGKPVTPSRYRATTRASRK